MQPNDSSTSDDLSALPRSMGQTALWLSVLAVAVVFGACSAALALLGLGVPFLVAALAVSLVAGAGLHVALRVKLQPLERLARDRAGPLASEPDRGSRRPAGAPEPQERVHELEAEASRLRHDLRGVLSPALMMADRMAAHADPAVQRAGEVVGRSVDRATALIDSTRSEARGVEPAEAQRAR